MKRFSVLAWLMVLVCSAMAQSIVLSDGEYSIDTIYCHPVGPGTWYTQVRMNRRSSPQQLDCYILQAARKASYLSTHTVLANDSIEKGERPSAMAVRKSRSGQVYFAGTNGDWWSTSRPGVPEGAFVTESTIAITPWSGRATLAMCAIDSNDSLYFGHDFFTDVVVRKGELSMRCNHVNDTRYGDELVLYNQYNGTRTHTDHSGSELRCRLASGAEWATNTQMQIVVEEKLINQGGSMLDAQHVVLSAAGNARSFIEQFEVGDTLLLEISTTINGIHADFTAALGGQNRSFMLRNGVIDNNWNERHPRTGLGFSVSGDTIIHCVVDGRGVSTGVSTGDLAAIMRYYGAWNAMNMEGGGSSTMYIRGLGTMNKPSDGTERAESQGIFCVSSAPDDSVIAAIAPYRPTLVLPRYGRAYLDFIGYNQYGLILQPKLEGVVLSCDPQVGYIAADGAFVCLGEGALQAQYNGVSISIPVRMKEDVLMSFRLDSLLLSSASPYPMEITTKIGNDVVLLDPAAFDWESSDSLVAAVSYDGVVTAVSEGYASVIGRLGSFCDTLNVWVEIPLSDVYWWDRFREPDLWSVTSSSGFNPLFVVPADSASPVDFQFTYKTARSPYIRLGRQTAAQRLFAVPDSLRISFSTDADIDKMAIGLKANNSNAVMSQVVEIHAEQGQPIVVSIPLREILGDDPAIYPIHLDYLRFPILTTTTPGLHHIWMDGICLIYPTNVTSGLENIDNKPLVPLSEKLLIDGRLYLLHGGRVYTLTGQQIK